MKNKGYKFFKIVGYEIFKGTEKIGDYVIHLELKDKIKWREIKKKAKDFNNVK